MNQQPRLRIIESPIQKDPLPVPVPLGVAPLPIPLLSVGSQQRFPTPVPGGGEGWSSTPIPVPIYQLPTLDATRLSVQPLTITGNSGISPPTTPPADSTQPTVASRKLVILPASLPQSPSQIRILQQQEATTNIINGNGSSQCSHLCCASDGTCMNCGLWRERDTSMVVIDRPRRYTTRSINKEIRNLPYGDDIKELADCIYSSINLEGSKKKPKKMAIHYCLFQAHQKLGQPIDPYMLGTSIGLSADKVSKSLNYYNQQTGSGYQNTISYIDPIDLIPVYCQTLRLTEDTIRAIVDYYRTITRKMPSLLDKPPRTIVAGIINYYMVTNGIKVEKDDFARLFQLSFGTINSTCKKISKIDNESSAANF